MLKKSKNVKLIQGVQKKNPYSFQNVLKKYLHAKLVKTMDGITQKAYFFFCTEKNFYILLY